MSGYLSKAFVQKMIDITDSKNHLMVSIALADDADVAPVVHGHWQERQTVSGYTYECSVCK
ncbi:MAG: hypothetical protein IJ784_00350 [Ruminiclostridium sp.]|nr:hypothetical protein [Ruminiclostridium sp.]